MAEMNGAQALVAQLIREGVDTVFGLPGVQIMSAFDAFYEQLNSVKLLQTRHEQATTYMADGYAKATGKVGVAMVVPGPGALNATAGLGTAYASSSPVLLISGQINSNALGKGWGELHEVEEQLDVFKPITKWNHRVTDPAGIPEAVREAFRQLQSGRPRPVELEIPPDTMMAKTDIETIAPEPVEAPPLDAAALREAAALLAGAERPAIIAGGGTISADAGAELVALAEALQAPVLLTQQSKGAMPADHPLFLGVNYIVSPVRDVFAQSDVILAVGTRFVIRDFKPESLPKVVNVNIDPAEIGRTFPATVGVIGDAKAALAALVEAVGPGAHPRAPRGEEITAWRNSFRQGIAEIAPMQSALVSTLRQTLADDAIVVSGVTNIGYWSNILYPSPQPRGFITSSYFGTLGYAFPTALGAKVACPDKQVVALCGDGGFLFSPQELSTARKYGIGVVAVVFNNHAFGASRWDQTHRFGERFIGTDLDNPDFMKLADAFGVQGMRTDQAGFGAALEEAVAGHGPVLLEVEVPVMMPPFQVV